MKTATTANAVNRDILDRLYGYVDDVLAERIVTCKKVQAACRRFQRDLEKSKTTDWPWRFDEKKACRPVRFMESFLVPTKGDYDSMRLLGWQCFVEGNLYGWVHKETGLRRFREGLIVVGKGNGKSTMMAGNAAFGASKDGERGADVFLLANTKEQAGIMFEECNAQISASGELSKHFRTLRDAIHYDEDPRGTIKHRSSDSKRLDGLNPHMAVFDELQEYRNYKLINVIRRGMNKRRQPLAIYITTKGEVLDGPLVDYLGLFTDAMEEGILRPEVADRMFCFIAELESVEEVEDPSMWIKANPGIGTVLDLQTLRDDWDRCKIVPSERANFINKQLNIFTNTEEMSFVDDDIIKRNEGTVELETLKGRFCYGGFDLSEREDFSAAALEFPLDDRRMCVLHHSWVTQRKVVLDNEKIDYYGMAMQGLLTIVPGDYVDQKMVFDWFQEQAKLYEIISIGYDPANATMLQRMLEMFGMTLSIVRQGPITLNDPMKAIKELLLDGKLVTPPYVMPGGKTGQDPLLRWYLRNVRLRKEAADREKANWMPVKGNRYRKIDGFMAWLDAHVQSLQRNPLDNVKVEPSVSVYSLRKSG